MISPRVSGVILVAAALVVWSCKGGGGGSSLPTGANTLSGTWTMGCTSSAGIGGLTVPGSASSTSTLTINNASVTYFLQGYSDAGCTTAVNTATYNLTMTVQGSDQTIAAAADMTMTQTSSSICTPSCSAGGAGATYVGLYLVSGSTLSINWDPNTRPTALSFAFNRQ